LDNLRLGGPEKGDDGLPTRVAGFPATLEKKTWQGPVARQKGPVTALPDKNVRANLHNAWRAS